LPAGALQYRAGWKPALRVRSSVCSPQPAAHGVVVPLPLVHFGAAKTRVPYRGINTTARIFGATLVVGALDIMEVIVFYGVRNGTSPTRIFQSVATGVLGNSAFERGLQSAMLGLALHFFIAFCVVCVYSFASSRIASLRHHPILFGTAYGLGVYLVMNFIVLPLSAAGPPRLSVLAVVLNGLFAHVFCVGIPAALLTTWRSSRASETAAAP
jgi:hypothetical protein